MIRATALVLITILLASACRERPEECQRLRQCCTAAQSSGNDLETVRMACTRKDDDQAMLCRRRLEEVVSAVPSLADSEQCRLPPATQ
jgi:hypothetical protein